MIPGSARSPSQRLVPGNSEKRVAEALLEERKSLLSLPAHSFPTDTTRAVSSGKTPYVRFDKNDYSIPHTLIRKPLTIVASDSIVRVLDGLTEVARHARCWGVRRQLEDERHLAALSAEKKKARDHRGRNRLFVACSAAEPFLATVALHGGHLGGTTSRLLRLLDEHGPRELDAALVEAHRRSAFTAQSVAHVLDQRRRARGAPVPIGAFASSNPQAQALVVTPHALDRYDRLGEQADPAEKQVLP